MLDVPRLDCSDPPDRDEGDVGRQYNLRTHRRGLGRRMRRVLGRGFESPDVTVANVT